MDREFTLQQLRAYMGERGYRMYVAYAGGVFDHPCCKRVGSLR